VDGGLLVIKPPGMTSHDVVEYVRNLWGGKAGHTGTLDPAAAGLLVLCLGAATRLAEYLTSGEKVYRAEITLGLSTETGDAEGDVLTRQDASDISADQVQAAIADLTGSLEITVPAYSAVSQNGMRLYRRAKRGECVELPTRQIQIYRWRLLNFAPGQQPRVLTEIRCSKGTYVRSLAEMLGQRLGTGGYLSFLVRTQVGPHRLEDAYTLAEIAAANDQSAETLLLSPLQTVPHLPVVEVEAEVASRLRSGTPIRCPESTPSRGPVAVAIADQTLICIAEVQARQDGLRLQPRKVFNWSDN